MKLSFSPPSRAARPGPCRWVPIQLGPGGQGFQPGIENYHIAKAQILVLLLRNLDFRRPAGQLGSVRAGGFRFGIARAGPERSGGEIKTTKNKIKMPVSEVRPMMRSHVRQEHSNDGTGWTSHGLGDAALDEADEQGVMLLLLLLLLSIMSV